uniref:Uncharacterized protein n=1 Tax=Pseudomonas phage PA_L9 TaxID=3232177 RepID=A0AAU8KYN3_9CAUD
MAQTKPKTAPVVEQAEQEIVIGSRVKFLGYDEQTKEEDRILEDGGIYLVVGFEPEQEGDDDETLPVLQAPNPGFNPKKKKHPETNPEFLEVVCFPEEVELSDEADEAEEEAEEEEVEEQPEKPARGAKGKAADKGKAAEKAPAKGKAVAKQVEEEPEDAGDPVLADVPDLEQEDPSVLDLVNDNDDLIAAVQTMENEIATTEFQIGGMLYHIKREVPWRDMDPAYAEQGGWGKFVEAYFNLGARKATQLIAIYVQFNQAGIANPSEVVSTLGWSKAAKLCGYLNEEGVDAGELIELAGETATNDLSTVLKETYREGGTGGTPGEKKVRVKVNLSFEQEKGELVQDIISEAVSTFGAATEEEALFQVLVEWRASNTAGGAAVDAKESGKEVAEKAVADAKAKRAGAKPASKPAAKPAAKPATKPATKPASRGRK